jgi:hypothetical protein
LLLFSIQSISLVPAFQPVFASPNVIRPIFIPGRYAMPLLSLALQNTPELVIPLMRKNPNLQMGEIRFSRY